MRPPPHAAADALVRDQWTGKVGERAKNMGNKSLGEGKTLSHSHHSSFQNSERKKEKHKYEVRDCKLLTDFRILEEKLSESHPSQNIPQLFKIVISEREEGKTVLFPLYCSH